MGIKVYGCIEDIKKNLLGTKCDYRIESWIQEDTEKKVVFGILLKTNKVQKELPINSWAFIIKEEIVELVYANITGSEIVKINGTEFVILDKYDIKLTADESILEEVKNG